MGGQRRSPDVTLSHWSHKFLLRSTALTVALLLATGAEAAHVPGVGDTAPSFIGYGLDGKKVLLESYAGKVIVVSFWASWCPPCRMELPVLARIQIAGKGHIQVVAINVEDRDVFRNAAKILKDFPIKLTNDESEKAFSAFGVKGLPHLLVIGKDLRIISVREGYGPSELDDVAAELNAALRAGLAEGAASIAATP
jgi:thiol-disulfide isomerase/thioredoxin